MTHEHNLDAAQREIDARNAEGEPTDHLWVNPMTAQVQNLKEYVNFGVDDALAIHRAADAPANARYVGWQCGFEPMVVAVWSYLPGVRLEKDEAVELALDALAERRWFSGEPILPDFVL
jgi:hypothetical protein